MKKKLKKIDFKCKMKECCDSPSGVYCLGFLGALIYNLINATGFWNGVLGILKAVVWPVFVVMKILGM